MAIGNPQDAELQLAADGVGQKVDNAELTRDDGTVVLRQRTVLSSDENPRVQAKVSGEAGRGYLLVDARAFDEINEKLDEIQQLLTLYMES